MKDISGRKAIVWVADGVAMDGLDYGVRLIEKLRGRGVVVEKRSLLQAGPVPEVDHHLLSGGKTPVHDLSSWMPEAKAMTQEMLAQAEGGKATVLGVCLGAQLIADCLWPGSVRPGKTIEVGFTDVVFRGPQPPGPVPSVGTFHHEEINPAAVEAGWGRVVATNGHSAVQAFRYGTGVGGIQFHPELSAEDMRGVIAHHAQTIEAYGGSVEAAQESVAARGESYSADTFSELLARVLPRWDDPLPFSHG